MKIHVLLLAAGEGARFGGLKQLTDIKGIPMVCHALAQCEGASVGDVSVCLGAFYQQIAPQIPGSSTIIQVNDWRQGMNASIKAGVTELGEHVTHALIALGDQVAITAENLKKLALVAQSEPDKIIAARYANTLGAPVIFPRRFFGDLLSLGPGSGAKKIIRKHTGSVVAVDIPAATIDIDTQHDKEAWKNGQM